LSDASRGERPEAPRPARRHDGGLPPRLCPERSLPAYAYVPGRQPHPIKHPEGHAFGQESVPRPAPGGAAFREAHRWACDLWNHGYPWEAHEAWEELWHGVPPDAPLAGALQGLIQAAAAHLKRVQALPRAEARLVETAVGRLRAAAAAAPLLEIDLSDLARRLERWHRAGADWPALPGP
jgi:hypothetical protein